MAYGELRADAYTVGLWHFNGNANDSSSYGNHGTVNGATLVNARFGQGYEFGTGDSINFGSDASLDDLGPLTIEFWLFLNSLSSGQDILRKADSGNYWRIYIQSTSGKSLEFQKDDSGGDVAARYNGILDISIWHHLVVTWNGGNNSGGNDVKLYFNGNLLTPDSTTQGGTHKSDAYGDLFLDDFDGIIDDLRLSNVVRTAEEIRQTYAMMKGAYGIY